MGFVLIGSKRGFPLPQEAEGAVSSSSDQGDTSSTAPWCSQSREGAAVADSLGLRADGQPSARAQECLPIPLRVASASSQRHGSFSQASSSASPAGGYFPVSRLTCFPYIRDPFPEEASAVLVSVPEFPRWSVGASFLLFPQGSSPQVCAEIGGSQSCIAGDYTPGPPSGSPGRRRLWRERDSSLLPATES